MTTCAGVAWCKGHIVGKNQTRKNIARGAQRWRMFEKRLQVDPKGSKHLKIPGTRRQLHLKIERGADGLIRKAFGLQFRKRAARSSVGLRRMMNRTLWGHRPPSETEKETAYGVNAGYGGTRPLLVLEPQLIRKRE
jgi:hypothetical protein